MEESCTEDWMAQEEAIKEKTDESGQKWRKVYFGGGTHFKNWLDQVTEIHGEANTQIEEIQGSVLKCYEQSGEKMYRIWAKVNE